jgi:hypothetical protein
MGDNIAADSSSSPPPNKVQPKDEDTNNTNPPPWYSGWWNMFRNSPQSYQGYVRGKLPDKYQENNWLVGFLMALPLFLFFIFVGLLILAGMTGKLTPFLHFIKKAIASVFTDKGSKEKD